MLLSATANIISISYMVSKPEGDTFIVKIPRVPPGVVNGMLRYPLPLSTKKSVPLKSSQ